MKTTTSTEEVSSDGMEKRVERRNWRQITPCAREKPRANQKKLANLWSGNTITKKAKLVVDKKPYGKSQVI